MSKTNDLGTCDGISLVSSIVYVLNLLNSVICNVFPLFVKIREVTSYKAMLLYAPHFSEDNIKQGLNYSSTHYENLHYIQVVMIGQNPSVD